MGSIRAMAGTNREPAYLTFSYRVKDAAHSKHLVASSAIRVWNCCNEMARGRRDVDRNGRRKSSCAIRGERRSWLAHFQVIQEVIDEFVDKRKQAGGPKPGGGSAAEHSARLVGSRSQIRMLRSTLTIAMVRGPGPSDCGSTRSEADLESGNFAQEDARGRWYCNIVCEIGRSMTDRTQIVGIDLGHKVAAKCSRRARTSAGSVLPRSRGKAR